MLRQSPVVELPVRPLIRDGRLKPLSDPRALELKKRDTTAERVRRDPAEMLRLLLSAIGG